MFGFFRSARRPKAKPKAKSRFPTRLAVESLERRDCPAAPVIASFSAVPLGVGRQVEIMGTVQSAHPSLTTLSLTGVVLGSLSIDAAGHFDGIYTAGGLGTVDAVAVDVLAGSSAPAHATLSNPAPSLSLNVAYNGGRSVTLSGVVSDDSPGGCLVNFSGAAWGSTVTNADGSFTYTTDAMYLGTVQATTSDAWWQMSTPAQVALTDPAPTLTLNVAYGAGRSVTLSGVVSDDSPGGCMVNFSGAAWGSTVTHADGSFSYTTDAMYLGTVQATTSDAWWQMSAPAQVTLANPAPTLTFIAASGPGHSVTLSGIVSDDAPGGCTVNFSGAASGSTVTNADGSFSYTTTAKFLGTVQATTSDAWWQMSSPVTATITNPPPSLTLSVAAGAGRTVTLSGVVSDDGPVSGRTVSFFGPVVGSAVTASDGSFTYTTQAMSLGTVQAITADDWGQSSAPASAQIVNQPPTLSLEVAYGAGRSVTLSGVVSDETPGGNTVFFSGAVAGSAITDATGHFSYTTNGLYLGPIQAMTTDAWGQTSNIAQTTLASQAPTLTLEVTYGAGRTVTLSGVVSDEAPAGETVTFSGMVYGQTTTSADGSFSFTATASGLGLVSARAVDAWGLMSEAAEAALVSEAPVIQDLTVVYNPDHWVTLQGRVLDESLSGLMVRFSGAAASIAGQSAAVDAITGLFSLMVQLQPDESGNIAAKVTDCWGLDSDLATLLIHA